MSDSPALATVLAEVGPRLKRLRTQPGRHPDPARRRDRHLQEHPVAAGDPASASPASSCSCRSPRRIRCPLEELVGAPEVGDPRIRLKPRRRNGRVVFPLTQQSSGVQVWKVIIPPERGEPELRTHEGYEWLYVLSGDMRLILAEHDITMRPGEVAEFDTRLPHWFGPAGDQPVEILSVHGTHGKRMHVRAGTALVYLLSLRSLNASRPAGSRRRRVVMVELE